MTAPARSSQPAPTPGQIEAYDSGCQAYRDDASSLTCPYPAGSENRLLWLRGYVLTRGATLYGTTEEE